MKNVFLKTENVKEFNEKVHHVNDVKKGRPGLMVVYGQAGRGKTECSRYYAVHTKSIYIRVMEDWTPTAMLKVLVSQAAGLKLKTLEKCKKETIKALDHYPRPVFVDEADRLKIRLIEHLRDIHDMSGAPVVLIGEPQIYSTISAHRRLWSRVHATMEFQPTGIEDIILFSKKAADLNIAPDAAQKLFQRTEGDFRLIWKDVCDLERIGKANNTSDVTVAMIDAIPARKNMPKALRRVK